MEAAVEELRSMEEQGKTNGFTPDLEGRILEKLEFKDIEDSAIERLTRRLSRSL